MMTTTYYGYQSISSTNILRLLCIFLFIFSFIQSFCQMIVVVNASQAAGTETLVGIVGKDFILIGADSSVSQSIALTASNLDKIAVLVEPFPYSHNEDDVITKIKDDGDNTAAKTIASRSSSDDRTYSSIVRNDYQQQTIVAAVAGDVADADRLVGLLQAHATIQEYEASVGCDVEYYDRVNPDDDTYDVQQDKEEDGIRFGKKFKPTMVYSEPGHTVEAIAHLARGQIANALRSRSPLQVCLFIAGMMHIVPTTATTLLGKEEVAEGISSTTMTNTERRETTPPFVSLQRQVQQAWTVNDKEVTTTTGTAEVSSNTKKEQTNNDNEEEKFSILETERRLEPRLFWLDEYGSLQQVQYGAHGYGSNFVLSILDQGYRKDMTLEEATILLRNCFQQLRTRYIINSPQPPCIKCIDAKGCFLIH